MTTREEVDKRLREMNHIACNTGIDSTPEEKAISKQKIAKLMDEIKEIDPTYWEVIEPDEIEPNQNS